MKKLLLAGFAAIALLQGCSKPTEAPVVNTKPAHPAATAVAWLKPDGANMDALFAQAQSNKKPLFLYWGAVWCPPCNQVKATVFNRPDFIERSQNFIPVYLDGDTPGAQKLASQFKVRAYPTMIMFSPDRKEITRLPGEVDAQKYLEVLNLALASTASVKESVQAVLQGDISKLSKNDWRQVSYYAWELDESQLVSPKERAATLQKLSVATPLEHASVATRLGLKSIVASANTKSDLADAGWAMGTVRQVLADPVRAREVLDVLINYSVDMMEVLSKPGSAERTELVTLWNTRLDQFADDASLSNGDRVGALSAKLGLARMDVSDGAKFTAGEALLAQVRKEVDRVNSSIASNYERQAVMPSAADLLAEAGMLDESDALLKAELPKAVSPYYHMLVLSSNAKKRGDTVDALQWAERAWNESQGPATRLQWGAGYVNKVIDLSPRDEARISKAALGVISELDAAPETFYERNRRSLEKMAQKLNAWNKKGEHTATVKKVTAQLAQVCAKLPEQDEARTACSGIFKPQSSPAKS